MITLKKAFEIAQAHGTYGYPLSRIADETDDFWIFYLDTDEVLIGPTPIAVEKKNGRVWAFIPFTWHLNSMMRLLITPGRWR